MDDITHRKVLIDKYEKQVCNTGWIICLLQLCSWCLPLLLTATQHKSFDNTQNVHSSLQRLYVYGYMCSLLFAAVSIVITFFLPKLQEKTRWVLIFLPLILPLIVLGQKIRQNIRPTVILVMCLFVFLMVVCILKVCYLPLKHIQQHITGANNNDPYWDTFIFRRILVLWIPVWRMCTLFYLFWSPSIHLNFGAQCVLTVLLSTVEFLSASYVLNFIYSYVLLQITKNTSVVTTSSVNQDRPPSSELPLIRHDRHVVVDQQQPRGAVSVSHSRPLQQASPDVTCPAFSLDVFQICKPNSTILLDRYSQLIGSASPPHHVRNIFSDNALDSLTRNQFLQLVRTDQSKKFWDFLPEFMAQKFSHLRFLIMNFNVAAHWAYSFNDGWLSRDVTMQTPFIERNVLQLLDFCLTLSRNEHNPTIDRVLLLRNFHCFFLYVQAVIFYVFVFYYNDMHNIEDLPTELNLLSTDRLSTQSDMYKAIYNYIPLWNKDIYLRYTNFTTYFEKYVFRFFENRKEQASRQWYDISGHLTSLDGLQIQGTDKRLLFLFISIIIFHEIDQTPDFLDFLQHDDPVCCTGALMRQQKSCCSIVGSLLCTMETIKQSTLTKINTIINTINKIKQSKPWWMTNIVGILLRVTERERQIYVDELFEYIRISLHESGEREAIVASMTTYYVNRGYDKAAAKLEALKGLATQKLKSSFASGWTALVQRATGGSASGGSSS